MNRMQQLAANRANQTILRGYGPLAIAAALLLLMGLLVPTVDRERIVEVQGQAGTAGQPGSGGTTVGVGGSVGTGGGSGQTATGGNGAGTRQPGQQGRIAPQIGCPDREQQVGGDPYSPPCIEFSGDNGGATARGVSADEIVVSFRGADVGDLEGAISELGGGIQVSDTPERARETTLALIEYFNNNFQFYGRRIRPVFFEGRSNILDELLGAGRAEAQADAIRASDEIGAFAEFNAPLEPYAEALTSRGVIALGPVSMSRDWMTARRPYAWSTWTDCSIVVESVSEFANKRLANGTADRAGDGLRGRPRTFGVVAPENPWYQECVDAAERVATFDLFRVAYRLDLASASNQANNMIARLKNADITTVFCGCDPVAALFLSGKAHEQRYYPEWIVTGVALTDQDIVAQLFHQDQWSRAFGISYMASPQRLGASFGYHAFKSVRPNDEPVLTVDLTYINLYLLAIGIHMAGPNLTPDTFEQGMFDYPGGTGPYGTWGFGPGNYTTTEDYRLIEWDPNTISPQNGERGAYVEVDNRRYRPGDLP